MKFLIVIVPFYIYHRELRMRVYKRPSAVKCGVPHHAYEIVNPSQPPIVVSRTPAPGYFSAEAPYHACGHSCKICGASNLSTSSFPSIYHHRRHHHLHFALHNDPNRYGKGVDSNALEFHSDQGATDLIALLSISAAKEGGESLLVSTIAIHNELLRRGRTVGWSPALPLNTE